MRPLLGRLLAGLMTCLPLAAAADPLGYVVGFDRLYRIDLANGQTTSIGPIGFNDVEGLAIAPNGTLYGVADSSIGPGSATSDFLVRIDTTTGAGTLVGPLGLQGQGNNNNLDYGLAATADGRLWMSSDVTGQLWEVSTFNGAVRIVGNTGHSISGLAARGSELYGVSVDAQPSLYRISFDDATTELVGPLNVGGVVADAGMDFDAQGQLWAVLDPEPASEGASRVVRINPNTGAGTVVAGSSVATVGMEGLAVARPGGGGGTQGGVPIQVPGPNAALLLLLAFATLAVARRRLV
jgi:hypothetical protein